MAVRISGGERGLGILGYLPLFGLIIAKWIKRDSMFVQFHARQGAVLFMLWLVSTFILSIVLFFVDSSNVATSIVFGIIFILTGIYLVMMLIGILKVSLGERYRMPIVADVALMMGL